MRDIALTLVNPDYYPLMATLHTQTKAIGLGYLLNHTADFQAKASAGGFTSDPAKAIAFYETAFAATVSEKNALSSRL